ncbi:nucleotidyltransferase [Lysobacteraceae bacterium NML120232]|nr:nucleotidyltransferase [Xanthomonadaceae bacterium NML08-0793]PJK12225.1 nucleotidyltransferase [Xanthomonadaceae bacterium NML120232]
MSLNVEHLRRTADTLQEAVNRLQDVVSEQDVAYDLFRNAAIKSFELSLETTGKLLRKALKLYGGSPREVDRLVFKDLFRYALKHGLMDEAAVERWFAYRENRNTTAHDYGAAFANETLKILPGYLQDVRNLAERLQELFDAQT